MEEILISSDSEDTIILGDADINLEGLIDKDDEVEDAVEKFIVESTQSQQSRKISYDLDSDYEDFITKPLAERLIESDNKFAENDFLKGIMEKYHNNNRNKPQTSAASGSSTSVESNKKTIERITKKQQTSIEKATNKATTIAHKNMKPGECMKFITAILDPNLIENYGEAIIKNLEANNIAYEIETQNNLITWKRKNESFAVNNKGELQSSLTIVDVEEAILIMGVKEFVTLVNECTLTAHIQSLVSVVNKKITLIIYGFENYIKYRNKMKTNETRKVQKHEQIFESLPKISKRIVDYVLTELQLLCNITHRFIDNLDELALAVQQFTKSIAEKPYKGERNKNWSQLDSGVFEDNRNCIQIDKNGNGLPRLWQQIFTLFPMSGLDTAEAVALKYPSLSSLMGAYNKCQTQEEGEKLLENLQVRRAAGPLTNTKKIGEILSKKIYHFFTSTDNELLL